MIYVTVTIDGPAGAGNSTAALGLADALGVECLDTGAMYRAVGLLVSERNVDPLSETRCSDIAEQMNLRWDNGRLFVNERDRSEDIRKPEVTRIVREIAVHPGVRLCLVHLQREAALEKDIVTEGRDQGTVVFPYADVKFFLTASEETRASRRQHDLILRGHQVKVEEVMADQAERDFQDRNRAVGALLAAADAIRVDTTNLDSEAVINLLRRHVLGKPGEKD